jgi:hypothetical protein
VSVTGSRKNIRRRNPRCVRFTKDTKYTRGKANGPCNFLDKSREGLDITEKRAEQPRTPPRDIRYSDTYARPLAARETPSLIYEVGRKANALRKTIEVFKILYDTLPTAARYNYERERERSPKGPINQVLKTNTFTLDAPNGSD